MKRCRSMAAMAISRISGSKRQCAISGCIRFSKAPMRSCASSSRATCWTATSEKLMTEDAVIRREGAAGRITLNRPKALNALNAAMTDAITAALTQWRNDDRIKHVVIDGAGGRAFCAGGDIRAVYESIPTDPEYPRAYWRAEYRLNAMIARYRKPYVALMDGFCLGGGVGLSAHGSHRIVTERSQVGMPETAIGFTPDVGGSWLLARAPGHAG